MVYLHEEWWVTVVEICYSFKDKQNSILGKLSKVTYLPHLWCIRPINRYDLKKQTAENSSFNKRYRS